MFCCFLLAFCDVLGLLTEQGHKQQPQQGQPPAGEKIFNDDELVNLIDPILNMDDHNRDGYIDYPEFVRAQQKNQRQEGQ